MNNRYSLRSRFTKATIASLIFFSFLIAVIFDRMFHRTLLISEENRLKGIVYTYLSAMDVDQNGDVHVEPASLQGTYEDIQNVSVQILNENGKVVWSNATATDFQPATLPSVGDWLFQNEKSKNHREILLFGLTWEDEISDREWRFTIAAVDPGLIYRNQMKDFRDTLWLGLFLGCIGLLLLQLSLLRWGFRPLKQIADEVGMIEQGKQHKFENNYPDELSPLTKNINSLLRHERGQQMRYQQALDNLAHALKTPLTALKNLTMKESSSEDLVKDVNEQVTRLKDILDYQVKKAAAVGKNPFAKPISLFEIVEKISRSLQKVYSEKHVNIDNQISQSAVVTVDEGDLYEVMGNILENAAKYCKSKIKISYAEDLKILSIEDDGPGFSNQNLLSLVQRGVRQDQRTEGSGIGLSVAYEIVSVFGGSLELSRSSALGGALVKVNFS